MVKSRVGMLLKTTASQEHKSWLAINGNNGDGYDDGWSLGLAT